MKGIGTRTISYRQMLALLLMMLTSNFLFGVIMPKVQTQADAQQAPSTLPTDTDTTDNFFTVTGSTGTLDEDSIPIADVDFNFVGHKTGKVGTVKIRYNIVAVEGANQGFKGFNGVHHVMVRFRDSDGHMTNQQVKFTIYGTSFATGVDTPLFTFDSNVDGANIGVTQVVDITDCEPHPSFDFDFEKNFYWIDAQVKRTVAGGVARLSGIQISESSSSSCPSSA
jgi:hypothetical protein